MFNLKALSARIRVPANKMVKDLTIKHRRKLFCKYEGVWYQFPSVNEVIIPFKQAKEYTLSTGKILPNPIDVNDLSYNHLDDTTQDKIPAVVLLGHFNHGKTTLLDALGGTTFVEEEKHSITQTIRTMLVSTSATKRITVVDTPGQEVFYRMRSYGASIADIALLLVAADDGIGLQTEESIGILEELGIPVIVCVNKIDTVKSPDRLKNLESQIREYEVLEKATIVQISAKERLNIKVLLEKLEALAGLAHQQSLKGSLSKKDPAQADSLNIIGAGTVLNILKNRQQGVALHVIIRHGEVRAGDWFSAGGWSGAVRSLQHSIPPVDLKSSPKSSNKGSKGKGKDKGNAETSNLAAVFPQIPLKDSTVASAGMAATLLVTLHQDGNDPRPIGDTVRFHRDASVIKKERKRRSQSNAAAAPSDLSTEQQEDQPISTAHSNTDTSRVLARSSPLSSHMQIEKKVKEVPAEVFATGKEAAEYCMERNQLEVKLAAYAISPQDATRFRLERLSTLFQKQKPGFREAPRANRVIDAQNSVEVGDEDGDEIDGDDEGGGESEEELEDDDIEDEGDHGADSASSVARTVVVKADSDITLGTLYDKYHDVAAARKASADDGDADLNLPPLCEVLHWGIGEVGLKDVNLASAGDALIIAYNVGVERSAARLALNLNVKVSKFDHIQEAADIIASGDISK